MLTEEKYWDQKLVRELRETYGDNAEVSVYHGRHHARYFRDDTAYHVISRTLQGYCLMRPDKWFNAMAAGVLGRAQANFKSIELYSFVFMASHCHLQLRGTPGQVSRFVGFVKGEISRRLGQHIGWRGHMWDGRFLATALPTAASEIRCLEYILAHGVKEKLVARSVDWPGLHAAKLLRDGSRLSGEWLNATKCGKAKYNVRRRKSRAKTRVDPKVYIEIFPVELAVLPAWGHLDAQERLTEINTMLERIETQGRKERGGRAPLGAAAVLKTPRRHSRPMAAPPWFEDRRKMICWADPAEQETRDYLDGYWSFQHEFREASDAFRGGNLTVEFPHHSFSPSLYRPPPEPAPAGSA